MELFKKFAAAVVMTGIAYFHWWAAKKYWPAEWGDFNAVMPYVIGAALIFALIIGFVLYVAVFRGRLE